MYCLITRRKATHKPNPAGVYRNATWQPIFPGAADYCFSGQQVLRPARYQLRIALFENQRQNGRLRKKGWQVALLDYWQIVDDYLDTLRTTWYRQRSVWGINEGRIVEGLREHFPGAEQPHYQRCLAIIMGKYAPFKAEVIRDYQQSEEYPLQLKRINGEVQQRRPQTSQRPEAAAGPKPNARVEEVLRNLVSFKSIRNKTLARELVVAGYRSLAHKCHPDKGGTTAAMQELTELKKQMLALLENGRAAD